MPVLVSPPPPPMLVPLAAEKRPVCRHFFSPRGCRNGDACRFSHQAPSPPLVPRNPVIVPAPAVPPLELTADQEALLAAVESRAVPAFALDVECVATGYTHLDRAVAQIGVVDLDMRVMLNIYVKPSKPVVSYLTPLTGITKDLVDAQGTASSLEEAVATLRAVLPKNAVVVGHNVSQDATWLNLSTGKDFSSLLDTAALFRVYDTNKKKFTYFGQDHVAAIWLSQVRPPGQNHDALGDAATSMMLLRAYLNVRRDPPKLAMLRAATLAAPRAPSFAVLNPEFEGVCQGNRRLCQCGAAHFS